MNNKENRKELIDIMRKIRKLNFGLITNITHSDFHMLKMINCFQSHGSNEGVAVSVLADELEISVPASSKKLTDLENKGYIERRASNENRRNTYVIITAKGYEVFSETDDKINSFMDKVLENMGDKNVETLINLINKLYSNMEREVKKIAENNKVS